MTKVLIAAPVRAITGEATTIFRQYLQSLRELNIPDYVKADKLFMLHESEHLRPMLRKDEAAYNAALRGVESGVGYLRLDETHAFNRDSISALAKMRNSLLRIAETYDYDYLFQADSDLILHPDTLKVLLAAQEDIISEIFWTRWKPTWPLQPSAWDCDNYGFENDSSEKYLQPGNIRTGMTGACTLISKNVFTNQRVNYNPIYNLSFTHSGEDRAFCIRAAAEGFEIYVNTQHPCRHLYRKSDLDLYLAGQPAAYPCWMDKQKEAVSVG